MKPPIRQTILGKGDLKKALPRAEALQESKKWLRELPRRDAEGLAASLKQGTLAGTRGKVVALRPGSETPALPAGDRPYAHPYYWAAWVLVGDPD